MYDRLSVPSYPHLGWREAVPDRLHPGDDGDAALARPRKFHAVARMPALVGETIPENRISDHPREAALRPKRNTYPDTAPHSHLRRAGGAGFAPTRPQEDARP